jgi:guanylate kinase/deoxycytidine triphosphate deaminase
MLVVLFGPSGVGKTSLSRVLVRESGFHFLTTYTTRRPRQDEDDRRCISDADFNKMVSDGRIVSTGQIFNARYALDASQLQDALSSNDKVYLVDFALENLSEIDAFAGHKLGVLVLPPDRNTLEGRLRLRGSAARLDASLRQYSLCLEMQSRLPVLVAGRVVINDDLPICAARIRAFVDPLLVASGRTGGHDGSFLADFQILAALNNGDVFDRGTWSDAAVHQASYGLRIDDVANICYGKHETETGRRDYTVVRASSSGGFFELAPGDSALLQSIEHFRLSPKLIGLVIPRGILVANSLAPGSSYVDPGFSGFFTIPVTNISGRVVRIPAGLEAARMMLSELSEPVGRPWSSADATSLRSELAAFPSRKPIEPKELRALNTSALVKRIQSESPLGPETAEAILRIRRALVALVALVLTWPVAAYIANGAVVQNWLADTFKGGSGFVGNVLAGLSTSTIVLLVSLGFRRRRTRSSAGKQP